MYLLLCDLLDNKYKLIYLVELTKIDHTIRSSDLKLSINLDGYRPY